MIITTTKRTRKRRLPVPKSDASQISIIDNYGPPASEDMGYEVKDLTHIYPGSAGGVPPDVEAIIYDEPGSIRYRGDPVSKLLEELERLKARKHDLLKRARTQARVQSLRTVKLRHRVIRYRTRREREMYFDDQGRTRYRWVKRREAYQSWQHFSVTRVEPALYRRLKTTYSQSVIDGYQAERRRILAEVSERKAQRVRELRKELRTAASCAPLGVIPIRHDGSEGPLSLSFAAPPDYPSASGSAVSWIPTPSLARSGSPIVAIDDGPGFSLMTAWASTNSNRVGYHQGYVILPFLNGQERTYSLSGLTAQPATIVPVPQWASRYDLAEGRAEIGRLIQAVQSGHLSEADRTFVLARSIGELKDLPATYRQGMSFLNSLRKLFLVARSGKARAISALVGHTLTSKSTLREAASWWLAWRFAIKPTADDVTYLLDNGLRAAQEIRRTLSELSHDLQDELVNLTVRGSLSRIPRVGSSYATDAGDSQTVDAQLPVTIAGSVYSVAFSDSPSSAPPGLDSFDETLAGLASGSSANYLFHDHDAYYAQGHGGLPLWTQVLSDAPFVTIGDRTLTYEQYKRNGGNAGLAPVIAEEADRRLRAAMARESLPLRVPVVYREKAAAAVTAQFWLRDLQALLFSDQGPLQMLVDRTELIFTAWELAPLSFVIDWLATTHRSILTLSDWVSKQYNGLEPRDMVVSLTNLLYAHSPIISRELTSVSRTVRADPFDTQALMAHMNNACSQAWSQALDSMSGIPCRSITIDHTIRCRWDSRSGPLVKTGIRRFVRGRYQRSALESVMDSMPRLRLRLDASKVATLLAMFGFR